MFCELCQTSDCDELFPLNSTFVHLNRPISYLELLDRKIIDYEDDTDKVCQYCLLKLKTKYILRQEGACTNVDPYIADNGILLGNPPPAASTDVCCQNCFTTDMSAGLYDMETSSFQFDGLTVTFVECFEFCIGVSPEERPFMCRSCLDEMKADYLKKHHKPVLTSVLHPKLAEPLLQTDDYKIDLHIDKVDGQKCRNKKEAKKTGNGNGTSKKKKCEREKVVRRKRCKPKQTYIRKENRHILQNVDEAAPDIPQNTDDEYEESDVEEWIEPLITVKEEPVEMDTDNSEIIEPTFMDMDIKVKVEPELMIGGDQASQSDDEEYSQSSNFDMDYVEPVGFRLDFQESAPGTSKGKPKKRPTTLTLEIFEQHYRDQESKQKYECKYCPISYPIKSALVLHVDRKHIFEHRKSFTMFTDHLEKRKQVGNDVVDYICTQCKANHSSYYDFKQHFYDNHYSGVKVEVFRCDMCDVVFSQLALMRRHKARQHTGRKSMPMLYQGKPMEEIE